MHVGLASVKAKRQDETSDHGPAITSGASLHTQLNSPAVLSHFDDFNSTILFVCENDQIHSNLR
jgi:hypothetical protein